MHSISNDIYILNQNHTIKTVSFRVSPIHGEKRYVDLGFIPKRLEEIHALDFIHHIREGAVSPITMRDAKRVAELISDRFETPVTVIKELKVPSHKRFEVAQKDENGVLRPREGLTEEDVFAPMGLHIENLENLREIIQWLEEEHHLSTEDRANLNPCLTKVEELLEFATQLTSTVTPAQRGILTFICEPYIDAIIEAVEQAPSQADLVGNISWVHFDRPASRRDLALSIFFHLVQASPATVFKEYFQELEDDCYASAEGLLKVFNGKANLDSTFVRQGAGVPYLIEQRKEIIRLVGEKLTQAFGPELPPDVETGLSHEGLQTLRARLLLDGVYLFALKCDFNASPAQILVRPWDTVLAALRGDFSEISWYPADKEGSLSPEEMMARFHQILSEVQN